jgi:hypothetical protein
MLTQLLTHILTHTPIYVWAILAFLIQRGMIAMRDREVEMRKLCIIPLVMLVLSLQDMSAKFDLDGLALAAWATGAVVAALPAWRVKGRRIAAGSTPGTVRVRGSRVPLAMMMAVFFTKYVASVLLAIGPQVRQDAPFVVVVCVSFGLFNGWFLGRLAADVSAYLGLQAGSASPAAPVRPV